VTLLIIGGLLIVALLAILGAVFLSVSEQRADKARTNSSVIVSSSSATPLVEQSSAASRVAERTTPLRQNLSPTAERPLSPTGGDQQQYALNGQFHELAVELQTLYQHAWELERRLRTLAEVADRIEKTNSNQIGSEEEIHSQSSADSSL
jgi:uncharacterized membrane protein YccC